ncbi:MAG: hypothetical protein Q7K57_57830 [Burkholderiaceae bacterium]|nr:hypothetical protein [Burkholderiaceae bacterium]
MSKAWRGLLAALRRSSPLAREIAVVLLVKMVLLSLLLHALSSGPKPGRARAQERTAQQLLGLPASLGRPVDER